MAGGRGGRKLALEALYEHDVADRPVAEILERHPAGPALAYAERLVGGLAEHGPQIDALIGVVAEDWTLERMPPIDRNALRIGVLELLYLSVPAPVAINEAVELAKQYSTADSGRFVNGILSRIDRDRAPV
ncbi:MAG: transcription antitermination factor NusB [Actinomycetota bacterium]